MDLSFVGFRAGAGRDGRIDKRDYYTRAMLFGAGAGVAVAALMGLLTLVVMWQLDEPFALFAEMNAIGRRMAIVFGAYSALVVAALLVYSVSRHEVRTLSTVTILGPFTLMRPWIVVLAMVSGLGVSRTVHAISLTAVSCLVVLGTGFAIEWYFAAKQHAARRAGV
jgi:hypothetical protein